MQADDAREAVDVLARLAGLDLSVKRRRRLAGFLEAVLDSAEELKSVDLEGFEPPTIFRAMEGPVVGPEGNPGLSGRSQPPGALPTFGSTEPPAPSKGGRS